MGYGKIDGTHVVVTGGAGFLGSHLCTELIARGARVTAIDNLITGNMDNIAHLFGLHEFRFLDHDVTDYLHVAGPIDAILHFASPASPIDYLEFPIQTLKVGALGTHKALGLARATGATLLLASTSEVYGDPQVHPQPETYWGHVNPIGPRGVYDEAKRFAEAITYAYHRTHDVDVRVVRIFNSVLADQRVVYDDGEQLRHETFAELAARVGPRVALEGFSVPAVQPSDGTARAGETIALEGHAPTGPCFEVRTRYGRSVKVTGDHSLFVRDEDGSLTPRPVTQLAVGDHVAITARIEVPERDRTEVDVLAVASGRANPLPVTVALTDELLWFLGLYVAEGCWQATPPKNRSVTLSCDTDTLDRAEKIVRRDLGLPVGRVALSGERAGSMTVHGRLLLDLLTELGFSGGAKRIPGWILGLPLQRLGWFLEGYREGDGVHSARKLDEQKRHEFAATSEPLAADLVVAFGRFGLVPSVGRYHSRNTRTDAPEGRRPFHRLTLCDVSPWSPLDWHLGVEQRLDATRTGDVVWAPVREIVEVEPTDLVYDFSVPGLENFWAGGGFVAHNTYGERMRLHDGRAVPAFIGQALDGDPITLHGDGSQTRSLCYVDDLIEGILRLLVSGYTDPVNIGNPDEVTILHLAETVRDVVGADSPIITTPRPVDDPEVRQPDLTVAERELGWRAQVSLRDGLERTVAWYRQQPGASSHGEDAEG